MNQTIHVVMHFLRYILPATLDFGFQKLTMYFERSNFEKQIEYMKLVITAGNAEQCNDVMCMYSVKIPYPCISSTLCRLKNHGASHPPLVMPNND